MMIGIQRCLLAVLAVLICMQARADWGLKFEVWDGSNWVSSVNAAVGDVVKFRVGSYFTDGTLVITVDGAGGALDLNRFTGSNKFTNFSVGQDVIQNLVRTMPTGNVALLTNTGNGVVGTTVATSFASQVILGDLNPTPIYYREIYKGEIKIVDGTARTLTWTSNSFGVGSVKGLTFYNAGSPINKNTAAPEGTPTHIPAQIAVSGCAKPGVSGPSAQSVCAGSQVSFSVTATFGPVTYQWRKNSNPIDGQTQSTLTLNTVNKGIFALNPAALMFPNIFIMSV